MTKDEGKSWRQRQLKGVAWNWNGFRDYCTFLHLKWMLIPYTEWLFLQAWSILEFLMQNRRKKGGGTEKSPVGTVVMGQHASLRTIYCRQRLKEGEESKGTSRAVWSLGYCICSAKYSSPNLESSPNSSSFSGAFEARGVFRECEEEYWDTVIFEDTTTPEDIEWKKVCLYGTTGYCIPSFCTLSPSLLLSHPLSLSFALSLSLSLSLSLN